MAIDNSPKQAAPDVPVYLFLGFLDAGKTKFIQETMQEPDFNEGEKTVLIVTEEGEEEYDVAAFHDADVEVITVDDESELTLAAMEAMDRKLKPERVIIEYNGMWRLNTLFASFPEHWGLYQVMVFAEAASFPTFDKNMRPLTGDKLKYADLVVFNRIDESTDKEALRKIVRSVNRRCTIFYEKPDGTAEMDNTVLPLPYDIHADVITVRDIDYAIFYQDLLENPDKYEGKTVKFRAMLTPADKESEHMSAAGRYVMTCCSEDITFCGLVADWGDGKAPKSGWFILGAKIVNEYNFIYGERGPVLKVLASKPAKKPQEEIATFY